MAPKVLMADDSHVLQVCYHQVDERGEWASLSGARIDCEVILGDGTIGFYLGPNFIIRVHCAKQGPKPFWPVQFGKDHVDRGETYHVKSFFLVQKSHCSVLLASIDQVNDHLDVDDVLLAISLVNFDFFFYFDFSLV
jgi:hypothetical protein